MMYIQKKHKIQSSINDTEEGIEICFNDVHSEKEAFSIEVTEDEIDIFVNEHPEKAFSPIDETEDEFSNSICNN